MTIAKIRILKNFRGFVKYRFSVFYFSLKFFDFGDTEDIQNQETLILLLNLLYLPLYWVRVLGFMGQGL